MPLTKQQRRKPEGHDHRTDRVELIDFSVVMGSAKGAVGRSRPGARSNPVPLTEQQRRESEAHTHRNYRVESADCSVAMKSAEGAMAAKPSGSAKQSRVTDEAAAS